MLDDLFLRPAAELGMAGIALASALWFAFVRVPQLFHQFSDDLRADRRLFQELLLAHDLKADRHHTDILAALRDHRTPEDGHPARYSS